MFKVTYSSQACQISPGLQKQSLLCAAEDSKPAKLSKNLLPRVNVTGDRSRTRGAELTCGYRTPAVNTRTREVSAKNICQEKKERAV